MATKVEAAVRGSNLGLDPARDGTQIRVNAPRMTAEHRENLVRAAKEHLEKAKGRVRRERTAGMKLAKAADGLGKDDIARLESCVGTLASTTTDELTVLFDDKKEEVESK
mmetsp:Transcript_6568/g.19467  ORF Transcript_6568/g.19467 Transcript_6568/m.19467 type:complete len:110 (+) Transcript_6568:250-579(+)